MKHPSPQSAAALAESTRAASFLDVAPPVALGTDRLLDPFGRPFGPPLVKLTPWRHHLLLGFRSPFTCRGEAVSRARLIQALYLCSPDYRHESPAAFDFYRARMFWPAIRSAHALVPAFATWLDDAFRLMPPMPVDQKDGGGRPIADTHWLAGWVRMGRKLFSMSEREVIHTPYVRLWQYLELEFASDPERPTFDRKLARQRSAYLRRLKKEGLSVT